MDPNPNPTGKGALHTLDIAPLRSESPPQKRSGSQRVREIPKPIPKP